MAVFPLANLSDHPELEVLFTSDRGVALSADRFSPYDYVFDWTHRADDTWIREERVMEELTALQDTLRYRRRRALGALIDAVDRAFGLGYLPARASNESDAELMQ